jgi:hypothetical protein
LESFCYFCVDIFDRGRIGTNQIRSELQMQSTNSTGKKYLQPLLAANPSRLTSGKVEGAKQPKERGMLLLYPFKLLVGNRMSHLF